MKSYIKYFAGIALLAASASCSKLNTEPEFEAKDNFAAFVKSSYSVAEDAGKLVIPVGIASVDPVATNVTYKVVDGEGATGAKQGVNYVLTDPSAVLHFDGKTREMVIELEIINQKGNFTGDLNFQVVLDNAGDINLGECAVCEVNIRDLDHPLALLLGEYKATSTDGTDHYEWPVTIDKDGKSVTSVILSNLDNFFSQLPYPASKPEKSAALTANVLFGENKEITGISIPVGQVLGFKYQGSTDIILCLTKLGTTTISYETSGNLIFNLKDGKLVCDQQYGFLVQGIGFWSYYLEGTTLVKK